MPANQIILSQEHVIQSPRRLHDHNKPRASLPTTHVSSTLWQQNQLMDWQPQQKLNLDQASEVMESQLSAGAASAGLSFSRRSEEAQLCPLLDQNYSELNLMHLRGSISAPFPLDAREKVILEMEQFAVQAEESARQARQLADWASGIVQTFKMTGPEEPASAVPISPRENKGIPIKVTLGPCPVDHSSQSDCQQESQKMGPCPVHSDCQQESQKMAASHDNKTLDSQTVKENSNKCLIM